MVINILSQNIELYNYNKKNKQLSWIDKDDYINFLFKDFKNWPYYNLYINNNNNNFENDKDFILKYYNTYIKYNKKINECLDDFCLTWIDDIDTVHDIVFNTLKYINKESKYYKLYNLFKDEVYKNFVLELYRKTLVNNKLFDNIISNISTNWKLERIVLLDRIILQMAICEFIFFPKIPPKVTINEYIEITKIYSTEKSKIFINGILNKIFKKFYIKNF